MKLFCPSPLQRQTLINPFSEKDIKSSSNPQAAVHIKSRIILHVHNHRKHYFLLKQIVLQKVWMLQVQRCFAFPSFNLSLIWYTCRCITIIFFLPIFLFQRGKLRNSSTILVFEKVLKTWLWAAGVTNISHTAFRFVSNDPNKLGILFAILCIPPTPLLCTGNLLQSCFLDDTYDFILYSFITRTIWPVSEVCLDKDWKFLGYGDVVPSV